MLAPDGRADAIDGSVPTPKTVAGLADEETGLFCGARSGVAFWPVPAVGAGVAGEVAGTPLFVGDCSD